MTKKNQLDYFENQELIQKLIDSGYGELIEAFLTNETKIYTKKSRLNKSGACRVLGWKPKQLEEAFLACRKILNEDLFEKDN